MSKNRVVTKTQAMRLLEGKNIAYEATAYDAQERDAQNIAGLLEVPAEMVFKTLVVSGGKDGRSQTKPILAIIPAHRQLDLKKLARVVGLKKLKMATHQQAETLTGLKVGGISPLMLVNRGFQICLDLSAKDQAQIFISSGERGIQIKLAPQDLVEVTGARLVDVTSAD